MSIIKKNEIKNIGILVLIVGFVLLLEKIIVLDYEKSTQEIIDKKILTRVEIIATEEQMNYLKNNTDTEPYIKVDVIINGTTIKNCGLRTKGSTIYSKLGETTNPTRFGYMLELDYYKKYQSYDGIKKISLNTNAYDKTTIREMICYDIYEIAGVKTVKRSLCDLTIAGKDEGIYTFVEVPLENFINRTYGNNDGVIYKPKIPTEDENKNEIDMEKVLNGKMFGRVNNNKVRMLSNSLKNIKENNNIEKYMDISSMIDYLVVCFFIDNHDSYVSETSRNYYIYQQRDKITFLPYDLDLILMNDDDIKFPVLTYEKYQNKPIIFNILNNDKYMLEYKNKISEIINYLEQNNYIYKRIDFYEKIVHNSMFNNSNNFYQYSFYKEDIINLKKSMQLRIQKVREELDKS
ncbi:MAG: CotH kinase family protein [Clostridia bacterium]|nr:CotH kinase family protein [Clostridia bacterium]